MTAQNTTLTRNLALRQWVRIVVGLTIGALGVYLQIYANIGLAPWDCLGMGIANHTPLNYGLAMTVSSVLMSTSLLLRM